MKDLKNLYSEQQKQYSKIYRKEILPIFRNYEVYRKKETGKLLFMSNFANILFILAFVLATCSVIAFKCIKSDVDLYIGIIILVAMFCFPIFMLVGCCLYKYSDDKIKKFLYTLKKDCLPKLIQVFGDIKWFSGLKIIPDDVLKASGLFADFSTYNPDDEFKGVYNGVPFKVSEMKLINSSNRHYVNVFDGVVISIKYNKQIKNRTIVARKNDVTKKNEYLLCLIVIIQALIPVLIRVNSDNWNIALYTILGLSILVLVIYFIGNRFTQKKEELLNQVILEDTRFCKDYNVYSSDQVEARYLVTPGFMEKFQNLKTVFGAKNIKCSFFHDMTKGDTIMFAIHTSKNLFEIGSMETSLEDPASIKEFYYELSAIFDMIDYFNLDKRIY